MSGKNKNKANSTELTRITHPNSHKLRITRPNNFWISTRILYNLIWTGFSVFQYLLWLTRTIAKTINQLKPKNQFRTDFFHLLKIQKQKSEYLISDSEIELQSSEKQLQRKPTMRLQRFEKLLYRTPITIIAEIR